jgi:hypothetical protein
MRANGASKAPKGTGARNVVQGSENVRENNETVDGSTQIVKKHEDV